MTFVDDPPGDNSTMNECGANVAFGGITGGVSSKIGNKVFPVHHRFKRWKARRTLDNRSAKNSIMRPGSVRASISAPAEFAARSCRHRVASVLRWRPFNSQRVACSD